jgi:dihydropteroate synthase
MDSFPFVGIRKPLLMGILNITPDSFSDGGRFLNAEDAISEGLSVFQRGASILDVGAESTRPGAASVTAFEQLDRAIFSLSQISRRMAQDRFISIDTRSAEVAEKAIEAGACIVNDVSAGSDPAMFPLVASTGASIILMHMKGLPSTMQSSPIYGDVVSEVKNALLERVKKAISCGIAREKIAVDPGIGFGKTLEHNLLILRKLNAFVEMGLPVVLGTSRKKFLSGLCEELIPADLDSATCATTALGVAAGIQIFRVHNVPANLQAVNTSFAVG